MSAASRCEGLTQVNDTPGGCASIFDRGLAYGDGLFETLRVQGLRPLLAQLHWRRLERGLERLRIPLARAEVEAYLAQFLARVGTAGSSDGIVKIVVSRGVGGRGFAPPAEVKPMVYLSWHALPEYPLRYYRHGITLHWCQQPLAHRPWLAGLKHLNCLEYVMAKIELADEGFSDGVMRDIDGRLVETTIANIFVARDGVLSTPRVDRCGIAGTMRQWILQAESLAQYCDIREIELGESDLECVDEMFVCNSVFGVMPVSRLGGYQWPRGPLTRIVQRQVWKLLADEA